MKQTVSDGVGIVTIALLTLIVVAGCSSAGSQNTKTAAPSLKPIDQVRQDILLVKGRLNAAIDAADVAVSSPNSNSQSAVRALRDDLAAAESAIGELRTTLGLLDQRADEYLAMWSKQATVTITAAGVFKSPNEQPQQAKAKYDQMLAALRNARDEINPALAELQQVATGSGTLAEQQARVATARERGLRGIDRLNESVVQLDEVKRILGTSR